MLSIIRRWLGVTGLEAEVERLKLENAALREGRAIVTPDGKVAVTAPRGEAPKYKVTPRANSWYSMARKREAECWRDMVKEAYPDATERKS